MRTESSQQQTCDATHRPPFERSGVRADNAGIVNAVLDAWGPLPKRQALTMDKLIDSARQAFDREIEHQQRECWAAIPTGVSKSVNRLVDNARAVGDVLSVIPDDLQVGIESLYNPARADLCAGELSVKLRRLGDQGAEFGKNVSHAYTPVERDLESIGATSEYSRLISDPIHAAEAGLANFWNQSPANQVETLSSSMTECALLPGFGKAAEAFDSIKAAALIEKAQAPIAKIDAILGATGSAATIDGIALRKYIFSGEKDLLSEQKAADRLGKSRTELSQLSERALSAVGLERVEDYRKTFFDAHPQLLPFEKEIVVHHGIEQQVLKHYPGVFNAKEIHDVQNLRGIPRDIEQKLHRGIIRGTWDDFYIENPAGCCPAPIMRERFLKQAREIDKMYGDQFEPPRG